MRDGKLKQGYYRFFDVADDVIVGAPDSPVPGTVAFDGASDNYFGANGHIGAWISDKSAVKIGVDIAHQNASGIRHDMFSPIRVNNSRWIIGLNPTFTFSIKNFDVRLGIHADYCSSTSKALFLVAPDVGIVWNAAKWAEVYFDADGGERFNSLSDLYNYSVFAPGFSVFDTMWNKVDAKAGIRLGSFRGFSAGVHAAYAATSDAPMPDILSFDSGRTAAAFCVKICLRLEIRRRFLIQVFRYPFGIDWWRSIFTWLWQRLLAQHRQCSGNTSMLRCPSRLRRG